MKSLCLRAEETATARPFIIASEGRFGPRERLIAGGAFILVSYSTNERKMGNPAEGVVNFVEVIGTEA